MKYYLLLLMSCLILTSCVKKSLHEEALADIEALEDRNLTLESRITTLQTQVSDLTSNNQTLIAENGVLADDLSDLNDEVILLQTQLASANTSVEFLEEQTLLLEDRIADLQREVESENVSKLEATIALVENDVDDAQDDIDEYNDLWDVEWNTVKINSVDTEVITHLSGTTTLTVAYTELTDAEDEVEVFQDIIDELILLDTDTDGNLADAVIKRDEAQIIVDELQEDYDEIYAVYYAGYIDLVVIKEGFESELARLEDQLAAVLNELRD